MSSTGIGKNAAEVRLCAGGSLAPTVTLMPAEFAVASGKSLALTRPLVVKREAGDPRGAAGTPYDVLKAVRDIRAYQGVASNVIDGSFRLPALGIEKFAPGVLPVRLGGTGAALTVASALPAGAKEALVGSGDQPLRRATGVAMPTGAALSVAGAIRLGSGATEAIVRSTLDAAGLPGITMTRPGLGEGSAPLFLPGVDLITPAQSMYPLATAVYPDGFPSFIEVDVSAHKPARAIVAVFSGAGLGTKTSEEIASGYGAAFRAEAPLVAAPAVPDAAAAAGAYYPHRRRYEKARVGLNGLAALFPSGFAGCVVCCVVEDLWGNLSEPAEFAR